MRDAHEAFDRGDFLEARRLARATLAASPDDATRAAAELVLKKTSLDPAIVWVTGACVILFVLVAAFVR